MCIYLLVIDVWFSLQLDQLVIDSAMEKREMEHKHALIQQRVRHYDLYHKTCFFFFYIPQRRVNQALLPGRLK